MLKQVDARTASAANSNMFSLLSAAQVSRAEFRSTTSPLMATEEVKGFTPTSVVPPPAPKAAAGMHDWIGGSINAYLAATRGYSEAADMQIEPVQYLARVVPSASPSASVDSKEDTLELLNSLKEDGVTHISILWCFDEGTVGARLEWWTGKVLQWSAHNARKGEKWCKLGFGHSEGDAWVALSLARRVTSSTGKSTAWSWCPLKAKAKA